MKSYIFTKRKGIHIIDLQKTVSAAEKAYEFVKEQVAEGKTILFVGTKKQAQEEIKKAAEKCKMPFIILRWLGGMLTNFVTVRSSINRLKKIDGILENKDKGNLTKRELLSLKREQIKLNNVFSGIKEMNKLPDILFVIDTEKESIAIKEAKKLGIPIVGVVDTNGDPFEVEYPIPGNDDAIRAISLFADMISNAVLEGKKSLQMDKDEEEKGKLAEKGEQEIPEAEEIKKKYLEYGMDEDNKKIRSFEKFKTLDDSKEAIQISEKSEKKGEGKGAASGEEKKQATVKDKKETAPDKDKKQTTKISKKEATADQEKKQATKKDKEETTAARDIKKTSLKQDKSQKDKTEKKKSSSKKKEDK